MQAEIQEFSVINLEGVIVVIDWSKTKAAVWRRHASGLRTIRRLDHVAWESLHGIDSEKKQIAENTERFLMARPANNVLLWGSRGTGKSSLIKALIPKYADHGLRMIEVDKEDLINLHEIVDSICDEPYRFIIYCDDLSFESGETAYKPLKSVLEGSLELPPDNVLFYATSNRRHLMPDYMADNLATGLKDGDIHPGEGIEEQVSLADRFGMQLAFYVISQQTYLEMVDKLFPEAEDRSLLHQNAIRFATQKGARNGRTANQFYRQFCQAPTTYDPEKEHPL